MKQIFLYFFAVIILSSCLKESIADAMLASQNSANNATTASLSFEFNGNLIQQSVNTAHQSTQSYKLACFRTPYINIVYEYNFDFLTPAGELTNSLFTDSLKTRNYLNYGPQELFAFSYYNKNYFVRYATDSLNFNITSYNNGLVSGNFSGRLSQLVSQTAGTNFYGAPGSGIITKGTFQNIPVYY